jgi:hypothetical protein
MTPIRNGWRTQRILAREGRVPDLVDLRAVMRAMLLALAGAAAIVVAPAGATTAAARCQPTPQDSFGPFGRGMPPLRAKIGTGHVLTGVVVSAPDCRPVRGAFVQFWQADRTGRYTRASSGTVVTDRLGRFRFQSPHPPSYSGRPPHIHIRVHAPGFRQLLSRYEPRPRARSGRVRLVLEPEDL